jgi:hypothetical protein
MAERGKPSVAHLYDKYGRCLYCGMLQINVERLSHTCTPEREKIADAKKEEESHGK